jgi:hypothetical protein
VAKKPAAYRGAILAHQRVVSLGEPVRVPSGQIPQHRPSTANSAGVGNAEVDVATDERGVVQSITVRCSCGREVTLKCEYLPEGDENEHAGS